MAHLHSKGIDFVLQRLVLGDTQSLRESRSPSVLLRKEGSRLGKHLPPVLLVHGTGDKIVPTDQSEVFCHELTKAGVRARLLFHEGQGHNDPVIHSPLMSNHETVQAIILSIHEWTSSASSDRLLKSVEPETCKACLADLPTWPRTPEAVRVSVLQICSIYRLCRFISKCHRTVKPVAHQGNPHCSFADAFLAVWIHWWIAETAF